MCKFFSFFNAQDDTLLIEKKKMSTLMATDSQEWRKWTQTSHYIGNQRWE